MQPEPLTFSSRLGSMCVTPAGKRLFEEARKLARDQGTRDRIAETQRRLAARAEAPASQPS